MFAFRVCSGVSCFFISSSCPGILGELPDPGSHPAVQPGPLAGPPVDADQRSIGHQWLERRHRFRAEVCGLQPGGDSEEDPVHPDVRGIHRPQITQVCPAATVWNLRVGLQTFFFFFIPRPVSLLSNVFILGLQFLFLPFFLEFLYIIYESIYITHVFEYIDLFMFDSDENKRKEWRWDRAEGGLTRTPRTRLCTCVYVCVCTCVFLCQHNHSFFFCLRCCSQTWREHSRFLTPLQRHCCPWDRWTDRQTTKDCDGVTWIFIFEAWWWTSTEK